MNKRVSIEINTIFYISYILMLFSWMFENILFIKQILPFIRMFSYFLCAIVIINNYKKFTYKKILINIVLTILILISSYFSKSNKILALWLFMLASENIQFDRLIKIDFISKCIFVVCVILLYFAGFARLNDFLTYTGESRSALGFANPNTFGYYMFSICADLIFMKAGKYNFFHFMFLLMISIFVSNISLSRTSAYLIMILAIVSIFSSIFKKILLTNFFKKLMLFSFALLTIFSVIVSNSYNSNNDMYYKINLFLSGRLINSYRYVQNYDIKIFGQEIDIQNYNGHSLYLDNAYLKLLLNEGLVSYFLIFVVYIRTIKKSYQTKNNLLITIMFIYMIYGLFENSMFWITGNIFLLYIFCDNKKNLIE